MLLTPAIRSRKGDQTGLLGRRTWARVTVKVAPRFLGPQLFVPLQPGPERGHDTGRDPPAPPPLRGLLSLLPPSHGPQILGHNE